MEHIELVSAVEKTVAGLAADRLSEIDFDELRLLLKETVARLHQLEQSADSGRKLMSLLQQETRNRAQAIARVRNLGSHPLLQLLNREELDLDTCLQLKNDIDREFDVVFSPRLRASSGAAGR
jgi:hypothetical protein